MRFAFPFLMLFSFGCGLVFDLDEPGEPGSMDAGARDAGSVEGCTSDAECDDSDICNGVESCAPDTGRCQPGAPTACSVSGPCMTAGCDPQTGCFEAPVECPGDGFDCTVELCDPASGQCVSRPDDSLCEDPGAACLRASCTIDAGCADPIDRCVETGTGTCDPSTGGCDTGMPCDPFQCERLADDPCIDRAYCQDTSCIPVVAVGAICPVDACTEGRCRGDATCVPQDAITCMPDGNLCTTPVCHPVDGCDNVALPNFPAVRCDLDGDPCTDDLCVDGMCNPGPVCLPPGQCFEITGCGPCVSSPSIAGTLCTPSGGLCGACDGAGRCDPGSCGDAGTCRFGEVACGPPGTCCDLATSFCDRSGSCIPQHRCAMSSCGMGQHCCPCNGVTACVPLAEACVTCSVATTP